MNRAPNDGASSIRKYAGIAPFKVKSGRQLWIHWLWNAPKFLRQTFVEWAGQAVPKCELAKVFYLQQRVAGKQHQAALRALAFTWIRVLWRCWHDRVPYNESRYIASLRQREITARRSPQHRLIFLDRLCSGDVRKRLHLSVSSPTMTKNGELTTTTANVITPVMASDRKTFPTRKRPFRSRAGVPLMAAQRNVVTPTPRIASQAMVRAMENGKFTSNGINMHPNPIIPTQAR